MSERLKAAVWVFPLASALCAVGCRGALQTRRLDCSAPQSIRDFKRSVLDRFGEGSTDSGSSMERWAACLCGEAAERAGTDPAPAAPPSGSSGESVFGVPICRPDDPGWTLSKARKLFTARLPLSRRQARLLTDCIYGSWCGKKVSDDPIPESAKRGLDCSDPQAIRDFKDLVYQRFHPASGAGSYMERWADCLCGEAGGRAGVNDPLPEARDWVYGVPGCRPDDAYWTLSEARKRFFEFLPLTRAEVERLMRCEYKDCRPSP